MVSLKLNVFHQNHLCGIFLISQPNPNVLPPPVSVSVSLTHTYTLTHTAYVCECIPLCEYLSVNHPLETFEFIYLLKKCTNILTDTLDGGCRGKWNCRPKFKSQAKLSAFHFALISLGKALIHLLYAAMGK